MFMKPFEINVALALLNIWQLECEELINKCEVKYNHLCSSYNINKNNSITTQQMENNLSIVLKSSILMNEINDVIQIKLCLLNTKSILLRELRLRNEHIDEIDSNTVDNYIKDKVLYHVIRLLENEERYEECNIINQKRLNLSYQIEAQLF